MEKERTVARGIFVTVSVFITVIISVLFVDGATLKSYALTEAECRVCHTGGTFTSVANRHHSLYVPVDFECAACHGYPIILVTDCTQCHSPDGHPADHDKTNVPSPDCTTCHEINVFDEHVTKRTLDCAICHESARQEVLDAISTGSGPEGQVVLCDACHVNAGMHEAGHDNVFPDSADCSAANCHGTNVMTEHTTRGWTCGTCHNGETLTLDPALVVQVITDSTGPYNPETSANCSSCHGEGAGGHEAAHDQGFFMENPWNQECSGCHTAMNPTADPNLANLVGEHVTKQGLACSVCHDRADHVFDAINKGRDPSNMPVYCVDCHTDATSGQGTGHSPVVVEPWSECSWCHTIDVFGIPEHSMHLAAAQDMQQDCSVCHVPEGTRPDCILCHALDQTIWDPLPVHRTAPNSSMNIKGPGTEDHDRHTSGIDCAYCHVSGIPGSEPLSAPYNECSRCHSSGGPGTDIAYGSGVHTISHIQGAEAIGQGCAYCHSPTPSCTDCHQIAGPNKVQHDTHTDTLMYTCTECHVGGIAGSEPLPEPYDQCSKCHNPDGTGSDIIFGSSIHTNSHIAGGEATPQKCDLCHGSTAPAPACTTCHEIAGPTTFSHDYHTNTQAIVCAECHVSGVVGDTPLPPPYNDCSSCHDGTGTTTSIMYGQLGHNIHMAAADNNCAQCHSAQPDCSSCHAPGHPPIPAPFNECSACHNGTGTTTSIMFGQPGHNTHMAAANNNCGQCHSAQPDCSSCHAPGHQPIPAPYNQCASCHPVIGYGQAGHTTHMTATANNCSVCHTDQPDCSSCHSPGHDPVPAPFNECDQCHTTLQPGQATHNTHRLQASQDCTVCHSTQATCSTCHVPSHPAVPAPYNECDQCHKTLQPGQATHDAHRLQANQNCAACHTAQPDCSACHAPSHPPVPAPFNACDQCHTTLQPGQATHDAHRIEASQDCTVCHTAQPDCSACHTAQQHGPIPAPYNECASCHTTIDYGQIGHDIHVTAANNNCASCHNDQPDCSACHTGQAHDPIPAPYNECDQCHTTLQPGQVTHDAHKVAATSGGIVDCAVCHTTSPAPDCGQCHTAGNHEAAHDNAGVPSTGCTNCHDANVVVEHVDNRNFTCATCHDNPTYDAVIMAGKAGTLVTCYDCHGENNHHSSAEAASGNCTHCHTDPRPLDNDPQQLACRECHIDNNGFVRTSASSPNHSFNTSGNVQDFGACFDCHAPTPYHAKPTSWPGWYEENQPAPGRGIFNVFKNELQPSCAGDCEHTLENRSGYGEHSQPEEQNDSNWRYPTSFNWFPIDYQGQAMDVPVFDQGQPVPSHPHDGINAVGNCGDCHTVGTVVSVTHNNNCQACHLSNDSTVQSVIIQGRAGNTVDCFDCHGSQDHETAHDMTELTDPNCSECHDGNVFTEHVENRQLTCSVCHESTDTNVMGAITNGMNGVPVPCQDCHGPDVANHEAAHDNAGVPSNGCTNCHDANVVVEHVTNRQFSCATCHDNSTYDPVINAGQTGTFVTCYDCHGENTHHSDTNAQTGNCTFCHADPRLDVDPNAPTGQLACRQCHVDNNGYVVTGSDKPSHAFNSSGNIQDFGACFDCHQPTPYHAKPTTAPRDCDSSAPGKGSFNIFASEFSGEGRWGRGEIERCDGREDRYRNPSVSFNWVAIVDQLGTNRQWTVPTFGSDGGGSGGGSQNDSVTITYASYSSRRDRLTVYAENSLGNDAVLSVSYDDHSYEMDWDSDDNRWEVRISTSRCNDSLIEVESSAGGTDSSSVSNCSSWGR